MIRRTAIRLIVGILVGSGVASADERSIADGLVIARAACSPCHAIGPSGDSPESAAPPFRELGRKYPVESLAEALAEGVVVGHPGMPQVKMNEREIGAFLAYLVSIQAP